MIFTFSSGGSLLRIVPASRFKFVYVLVFVLSLLLFMLQLGIPAFVILLVFVCILNCIHIHAGKIISQVS